MPYRLTVNGVDYVAQDLATLQKWVDEGRVVANSWVWKDNLTEPVMAQDITGLRFGQFSGPPTGQASNYVRPQYSNVPNYLVLAIFSTLCCCIPFGVVSIVYAAQVDGHVRSGNQSAAIDASNKAKGWATASIICGILGGIISIALQGIGHGRVWMR